MRTCKKCGEEKPLGEFRFRDSRHTIRRWDCHACYRKDQREQYAKNRKHRATCAKRRRKANPNRERQYAKRNSEKVGRYVTALRSSIQAAKRRGGVPCTAVPEELEIAFNGKCHVCGVPELELTQKLHADHCHKTGAFRGWLCSLCNMALGALKDSPEIAMNLALYAERHRKEYGKEKKAQDTFSACRPE